MSNYDDLQPDLQPVIDQLRANRPEATALELDAIKQRVRARSSQPARRRTTRRAQLMKSRMVILTMLVLGMLLSTDRRRPRRLRPVRAGQRQHRAVRPATPTPDRRRRRPRRRGLGQQRPRATRRRRHQPGGGGNDVQPARQVEAGANDQLELPFTGFAAIPILLGGIALLSAGLVLRRRTGDAALSAHGDSVDPRGGLRPASRR